MKKLSLLIVALLLTFAMFACNNGDSGDTSTETTTAAETEASTVAESATTTAEAVTTDVTTVTETTTAAETTTEAETTTAAETTTEAETTTTAETTTESETTTAAETTGTDGSETVEIETISIAEALELCGEDGNLTTQRYYIKATVVSVDNAEYGQMTVKDATGTISVYRTDNADGTVNYSQMTDKPYKGDEVLLWCTLQNYGGKKEVKSAYLISFVSHQNEIDDSSYTAMSIADAREASKGDKVKVTGVVSRITYATGMKPSGVMLIDESGSIYVYSADVAQRVQIGNKITVLASKTYWVLEKEAENAAKWGYKGCCQLEDATLFDNDNSSNKFPTDSIQSISLKAMLETPIDGANITTQVFKVNALVSKQQNPGFVNYYFYDIDGKTGSYAYTQCNGSDFAWLDKFDGKICTVYLTPLNAKSESSACYYRLLPVEVMDEGYTFDKNDAPAYAMQYHLLPQFTTTTFAADPAQELITSVSSQLLGFEGVTVTYTSDNDAVKILTENGKTVMHCEGKGTANVKITATLNGVTAEATVVITSDEPEKINYVSVEDAIAAEVGETVTVRGIVGTSVINKDGGFYLVGDESIIAVLLGSSNDIDTIKIGDEIIIKGTRDRYIKRGYTMHGQTCITGATVEANYYGDNGYVMDKLAKEISPENFYDLDENLDLTTSVYRMTALASVVASTNSTNVKLIGADTSKAVSLYSGNKYQYDWMADFDGKTITVDIAACNWNSKAFYRGCILAVYVDGERVALNDHNF